MTKHGCCFDDFLRSHQGGLIYALWPPKHVFYPEGILVLKFLFNRKKKTEENISNEILL
jgi:hypothetical protein